MSSSGKHPAAPGADFLRHGNDGRNDNDNDNADNAAPASTGVEGYMSPAASTQV